MTPTQKGRRSDALYMDTRTTHRRQLCDMVVNREADIEDLKEEIYGLQCDIGRLENENAELRELTEILMPMVMRSQRYCSHICDVREQCVSLANPVYGCIKRKDIMNRADKLGIEVDG